MQIIGQNIDLVVFLVTYNHEYYIEQAIKSILEQKTKYSFMLYIMDDASTDNTTKIIKKFQNEYPDKIILDLHKVNSGGLFATKEKMKIRVASKYITYLDGDDYWCSADKIEKQLDFLESNYDYVSVAHATKTLNVENPQADYIIKPDLDEWDLNDMLRNEYPLYCHTSSYIRRNIFKKIHPDKFYTNNMFSGDSMLSYAFSEFGKSKYLDEVMSVYRITNNGMWTSQTDQKKVKDYIELYYRANEYFEYKYYRYFLNNISCAEKHYKEKYCFGVAGSIKYYIRSIGVWCRKTWIKINPKRLRKKFL